MRPAPSGPTSGVTFTTLVSNAGPKLPKLPLLLASSIMRAVAAVVMAGWLLSTRLGAVRCTVKATGRSGLARMSSTTWFT